MHFDTPSTPTGQTAAHAAILQRFPGSNPDVMQRMIYFFNCDRSLTAPCAAEVVNAA